MGTVGNPSLRFVASIGPRSLEYLRLLVLLLLVHSSLAFSVVGRRSSLFLDVSRQLRRRLHRSRTTGHHNVRCPSASRTALHFFDKMFEESGPLGKGLTVGKVQVALTCGDRSRSSIFGVLEEKARSPASTSPQLARLANEVCLALLRQGDSWTAAASDSKWYSQKDASKAESQFNDWTNREAYRFEKVRKGATVYFSIVPDSF